MPIHDMKCTKCGKVWQDWGLTGSRVIQKCSCGCLTFKKLPSKVAVKFSGEGWATPKPKGDGDK